MKNIETCKSEEVLSSVLDQQPQDYPSVQQAVHDLGVTALPAASAADPDIAELPSNVEVFVRRVLKAVVYDRVLPVVQQMWQAVLNRILPPNYLPDTLLPYAQDPSLRTLGTLPTALSALSPRKISNGGATSDGIKDGVSLAHLLGDSSVVVTKLEDDNKGWTWNRALPSIFGSLTKLRLSCAYIVDMFSALPTSMTDIEFPELLSYGFNGSERRLLFIYNNPNVTELTFPKLKAACAGFTYDTATEGCFISTCSALTKVSLPELETYGRSLSGHGNYSSNYSVLIHSCANLEEVLMPKWTGVGSWRIIRNCPKVWRVVLGNIVQNVPILYTDRNYPFSSCVKLRDLEFAGVQVSLDLSSWTPDAETIAHQDFLPNFLHHLAERLAVGPTTNRLTLTLSADVYSACGFGATIDDTTDIRYLIKKAIQDRNWKVTDGTNNFNQ